MKEIRRQAETALELAVAWVSGERDHVADVLHAGDELDEPLKADAEAGVRDRAILAQVEVPPVVFEGEADRLDLFVEQVVPLLSLGSADDFADFGDEHVHCSDRFFIGVFPHVEGFDLFWVVGEDNRLFAVLFGEIPLVFRLEVVAPIVRGIRTFFSTGLGSRSLRCRYV